jgi:hypothetical protein
VQFRTWAPEALSIKVSMLSLHLSWLCRSWQTIQLWYSSRLDIVFLSDSDFYPYKYLASASSCLGSSKKQRLLLQAAAPLYSRLPVVPCQILTHRRRIARMLKWEALIPVTKLNWRGWDISRSSSAFDLTYPSSWRSPATRRDLTLLQVR